MTARLTEPAERVSWSVLESASGRLREGVALEEGE